MRIPAPRQFRETSFLKRCWDCLVCAIALGTGILLPIELLKSFSHASELNRIWTLFSLVGLIDIGVSFNTTFEHNGREIRRRTDVSRHYLHGMFWLDLAANLPFLITQLIGFNSIAVTLTTLLRLPRLLYITGRWADLQLMSSALIRMLRFVMSLALIANAVTCLWLWVGLNELGPTGWIQRMGLVRDDFPNLYLHSLYWTVTTLATVGYGDITAKTQSEMLLAIIVMIMGAILMAIAIGNVVGIINQLDEGRREHRNRQSAITSFLRACGVNPQIVQRIRSFNDYKWSRTKGIDPEEMISGLPRELRSEVTLQILGEAVSRVPLLNGSNLYLRKRLLAGLTPCSYPPNTVVLEHEEIGHEIIFVTSGWLAIESEYPLSETTKSYRAGEYVGDLSFFLRERRNARVVSMDYVDAFCLDREAFDELYCQEPELKTLLKEISSRQSERNQELLLAGVIV